MIYELNKCPICGSSKLNIKSKITNGGDTIIKYQCLSCDGIVTNNSYLSKENNDNEAVFIYGNAIKSVVEITSDFGDKSASGTGILLKDNYVLTNAHIITDASKLADSIIANYNNDFENYNLEIISVDDDLDIALLKIEHLEYIPIDLEQLTVNTGEKVYAIGNAIGQGISIVEGIVSDSCRNVNGHTFIMHSAPVNHGNSGGPLYNSKGQVIGMISSSRKDAKNMGYAIPNNVLIGFIDDVLM